MANVSEVTIKYAARGARAARKADEKVRDSVKETAKTARSESGTISRWMQRHRNALIGIGAASAAAMGAIIKNSPALSAELATVRLGFSLLAMQIGNDLAPAFQWAGDLALDASDAYSDLPDPVRKVTSAIVGLALFIGTLAGALAGLQTLISGTFVATLGSKALSAVVGFVSGSLAFAAAVGLVIGLIGVWILQVTGVLDWVGRLGSGLRNIIGGPLADFILTLLTLTGIFPLLAILGGAVIGFIEGGFSGAIEGAKEVVATLWTSIQNTFNNIAGWLTGTAASLISGAVDSVIQGAKDVWDGFKSWLIGNSFIPDLINDVAGYLRGAGANLIGGAFDSAIGAMQGAVDAVDPRNWGSDLMNEFESGISSAAGSVQDTASGVADSIGSAIGFDNVQNDRMARRWGSDLLQEFAAGAEKQRNSLKRTMGGMAGEMGGSMQATPRGTGGGGGGSPNVTFRFERGAIRQRDDGTVEVDRRNVTEEQGAAFDARSNI